MGSDISAELSEAKQLTARYLADFHAMYLKLYVIGLVKARKKQIAREARGPQWRLMKCNTSPPPETIRTGVVGKLSKYLKRWNPRFMVVRGDHLIDYYESEEKFKANPAKPLGTIHMSNLTLHRDANSAVRSRRIALAEQCRLSVDDMPKPDPFPEFTLEIWHERKGPIYLVCKDETDGKAWCDVFERCRWLSPRYRLNEDKAHGFAFPAALRRTRRSQRGMSGWWWSGGDGEEAMLSEAINDMIADVILRRKLDCRLTTPWAARSRVRKQFIASADGVVTSAVKSAWKSMYQMDATKVRRKVTIEERMPSIMEAEQAIQSDMWRRVEAYSKYVVQEELLPHLQEVLNVIVPHVRDAFSGVVRAFDVAIEEGRRSYAARGDRLHMVSKHHDNAEVVAAERHIWDLYEPQWAQRVVFEDVSPWIICGRARRRLRKTMNNALYTFENILEEGRAAGKSWDEAAAETRILLVGDCQSAVDRVVVCALVGIAESVFEKRVIRPARSVVSMLTDRIPRALYDFIDPEDLLDELMYKFLRSTCAVAYEPYTSRMSPGADQSTLEPLTAVPATITSAARSPVSQREDVAQPPPPQPNVGGIAVTVREARADAKTRDEARRAEIDARKAEEAACTAEALAREADANARRGDGSPWDVEEETRAAEAAAILAEEEVRRAEARGALRT